MTQANRMRGHKPSPLLQPTTDLHSGGPPPEESGATEDAGGTQRGPRGCTRRLADKHR